MSVTDKVELEIRNFGQVKSAINYSYLSHKITRKKKHFSEMFWEWEIGTYSVARTKPIKFKSHEFNLTWKILSLDIVIRLLCASVFNLGKSRNAY